MGRHTVTQEPILSKRRFASTWWKKSGRTTAFMKAYSDEEARKELRTITVSDYVNLNGLAVTQYQDYGWEPVKLYK